LVMGRGDAQIEQSLIMKSKDEKGDKPERSERRRRDEDGEGDGPARDMPTRETPAADAAQAA